LAWQGGSESAFNKKQTARPGFYFGDEIFAKVDSGKVEPFDLLKVDEETKTLYIIHVKLGFGAKMRDACSQILVSADIISRDTNNGKKLLSRYYREAWRSHAINKDVNEEKFLSWFDYELVFTVLCSTKQLFNPEDFEKNRLYSHIARREILATKNEMKRNNRAFRLAHTKFG
jgi:hypothetical protein